MLLAVSLAFLSPPLLIDWNGEPLGKALEGLGPRLDERLTCDSRLAREPIFGLVGQAPPQEVLDRIAEVMVASWQREKDGGLRLVRQPMDARRALTMRRADTERRYGESVAAYVKAAGLSQAVTYPHMAEAMRKLKVMAQDQAPDPLGLQRTLTAGLASGRLLARCLAAVGIDGLSRVPAEGRFVFSSAPTPRQGTIPSSPEILRALTAEHPVYVAAYEGIGSIGGASDGRPNTVDDLDGVPTCLRLEVSRSWANEDLSVTATVFAADGTWLFNHSETLPSLKSTLPLPGALTPLPDAPERRAQFESLQTGRRDPGRTEAASMQLMRPDPLAPVFGERLRAIARKNGRNLIARFPDRPLLSGLESSAQEAIEGLLDYVTLSDDKGWVVGTPRDPLSTEERRTSRSALFALSDAYQRDPKLATEAHIAFVREVPRGIYHSLAYRFVRHFRNPAGWPRNGSALMHVIASCSPTDLRFLASDSPTSMIALSARTRAAIEHFIFDVPENLFTSKRRLDGQWTDVTYLETAEPTSRIPGAVTGDVFAHLEMKPEWEIMAQDAKGKRSVSLVEIAHSLREPTRGFSHFYLKSKTAYRLKVWVGEDWLESFGMLLGDSEFGEKGLAYGQLPAALRFEVEAILRDIVDG